MITHDARKHFFSWLTGAGAFTAITVFGANPSAAQTSVPFAQTTSGTACDTNPPGISCAVKFNLVADNHRLDVTNVSCTDALLATGGGDVSESVTLRVVNPANDNVTSSHFLIPVQTTSTTFLVSQGVFVPVPANRRVEILVAVFGGTFVGALPPVCTISGQNVTLP